MRRLFTLSLLFLGLLAISLAQISYETSYSAQAGNPGGLNTQMDDDTSGWATIMPGGFITNQWSNVISLPFSFDFYGQSFVSARVSANGIMAFTASNTSLPGNNEALPTSTLPDYSIAAFWEEFAQNPPVLTNDKVISKTFGTAPNRQFWLKWSSYQWGPSSFANIAIVLEEGTNRIYMVDQYSSPVTAASISSTVGVQKNSQTAVMSGNNISLEQVGFHFLDNHYYTYTPYQIPPEDLRPMTIIGPESQNCGLDQETISVSIKNQGQQAANSYVAKLFVNGNLILMDNEFQSLQPGDSLVHTFSQAFDFSTPGEYEISVVVSSPSDGNTANDSIHQNIIHLREINDFPFQEDFESANHGWTSGGTNSSWEWGTPADSVIMGAVSGIKAWGTNLTGKYNAFESSWVESPCFNLANVNSETWVSFQLWWETEDIWDGASLTASIDGGQSWIQVGSYGPVTWFNDDFIPTLPGGVGQGWNGTPQSGKGSEGWKKVFTKLPAILLGEDHVRFRLAFASNSANQYRGIAMDDFTIGTPPQFELGQNRFFCEGDTLRVGQNLGSYQWSQGSSQEFIVIESVNNISIIDSMLTLTITDSLGLERRDTLHFSVAPRITASVASIEHVDCFGTSTGSISLNVEKGTAPYGFDWNVPTGEQNLTEIEAGIYHVTIFDLNGCQTSLENIVLTQNDSLGVISEIEDIYCHGDSSGSIQVSGFGGVGPYTYAWENGDSSQLRTDLKAGLYEISLSDSLGCILRETVAIFEPEPIEAIILDTLDATCDLSSDGEVKVDIRGGMAPYTLIAQNDSLEIFKGNELPIGTYEIFVEDSFACNISLGVVEIQSSEYEFAAGFEIDYLDSITANIQVRDSSIGADSLVYLMGNGEIVVSDSSFTYSYTTNGDYTITQILYNPCGTDTAYAQVQVRGLDSVSTSLEENREKYSFAAYPNPTSGTIFIKGKRASEEMTLFLMDLDGRVLLKEKVKQLPHKMTFPERINKGIYIIQLKGEKISWREKILYR
ncbi:MAG: T9SS type A sorting domain-containing protein [Bacteroidia bacterium]|nr:T9SS type A sorting domain-containing protein [Bacteroidia bacterium]